MSIFLNAFPLKIADINLDACIIPYSENVCSGLRDTLLGPAQLYEALLERAEVHV